MFFVYIYLCPFLGGLAFRAFLLYGEFISTVNKKLPVFQGLYLAPHIPGGLCWSPGDFPESTQSPVAFFWLGAQWIGMHNPPEKRLQKNYKKLDIDYKSLLAPLTAVVDIYLLDLCWPRLIQSQPAPSIPFKADTWWGNGWDVYRDISGTIFHF